MKEVRDGVVTQNSSAFTFGRLDSARDFIRGYERPHAIVNCNDFDVRLVTARRPLRTDSARVAPPGITACDLPQIVFASNRKKAGRFLRGYDYYDFLDHLTLLKGFESVENNGGTRQLQKLFWPLARHPRALPGGGNDCDIHQKVTGKRR